MNLSNKKIVILDRDGVINRDSDDYIKSPEEWIPLEGSLEAIARLNHYGYRVFIFTNQSGIARGFIDEEALEQIHNKMETMLAELGGKIEKIFYCPHGPDDDCDCRKPGIGMLKQIEKHIGQAIDAAYIVGDSKKDIEAAVKVKANPVLVLSGKTISAPNWNAEGLQIFPNLKAFSDSILPTKQWAKLI